MLFCLVSLVANAPLMGCSRSILCPLSRVLLRLKNNLGLLHVVLPRESPCRCTLYGPQQKHTPPPQSCSPLALNTAFTCLTISEKRMHGSDTTPTQMTRCLSAPIGIVRLVGGSAAWGSAGTLTSFEGLLTRAHCQVPLDDFLCASEMDF